MAGGEPVGQSTGRRRRRAPRRRRLDPGTARTQLLDAGRELVSRRYLGDTLSHLRISDLAREAGVTSGAFYHYWDGQAAYRDAVLAAVLAGDRADADPELLTGGGGRTGDRVDRIVRAADGARAALRGDPGHRLELALWAHDEPRARRPLRERARRTEAAWAHAIGGLLEASGRHAGPVGGLDALAALAVALGDGLRTEALVDDTVLAGRRQGPSPASLLALLLLVGATEAGAPEPVPPLPAPGPDPGDDQERRRHLVDLGVAAVRAQPTGNALDHVKAEDVVARLGLTIGAFYHYWETQDAYRDDLLDALLAADRYVDPAAIAARAEEVAEGPLEDAVRTTTSWYWSIAGGHPENRMIFGFLTIDDPYIAERLAADAAGLRRAWHTVLEALLSARGLHLRPPLDPELVVLGLSVVLDGLIVRHDLDPGRFGPDDEGWTAWGRGCLAMVRAASAPEGDDRDLLTLARDVLGA